MKAAEELGRTVIKPKSQAMEEAAELDPEIIQTLFERGLMGIEIPERYGGSGGTFFMSILAIEQISRAAGSEGEFIEIQNTHVNIVVLCWESEVLNENYLHVLSSANV